jgi:BON domain
MSRIHHHPRQVSPLQPARAARVLLPTLALALIVIASGCKTAPANDASLSTAVQSRITSDGALANEPIQTASQNGIVTLTGSVSNEAARSLAANDAAQVSGVRTVVNNLTVSPQQAIAQPAPTPQPAPPPAPTPKPAAKPTPAKPAQNSQKPAVVTQPEISQYGTPPPPAPIERPEPQVVAAPPPPPPPPPAFKTVTIASGETIPVRITQNLDSETTQQGDSFTGVVAADVIIDGLVALPQGTPVTGRVSEVHEAAHYKGSALLTIELTNINRKGEHIPVVTEAYSKEGAGRGKNTAEKVGGGAAVGAILGGILGGGKGAAIGAAAGGGVGAGANTVTRGQQVQIPSETLVRFKLTNSIAIHASTKDAAIRQPSPTPDDTQQRHPLETPPQQ